MNTMDLTPLAYAEYDSEGRITARGVAAQLGLDAYIAIGKRIVRLPVKADPSMEALQSQDDYVDLTGEEPVARKRPVLDRAFDRTTLPVDEEAIMPELPACTIAITGPWEGNYEHGGGDLHAGFSVPGTYTLAFEIFPNMPSRYALTVEAQS